MVKIYTRWQKQRRTRQELYALSERELNDIGINRGDIERIVSDI